MELLTPVSRQKESTREQLILQYQEKAEHMQTKDYEIGFIVVAAVAVITLVLISFVTPAVTSSCTDRFLFISTICRCRFHSTIYRRRFRHFKKAISAIIRFFKRECYWHTTM